MGGALCVGLPQVALLLCNAGCLEALPLFLDKIATPLTNIIMSVTAVLFFGEIIPQAICVRYGLTIGAAVAPFVKVLLIVAWPIAFPISKLLDALLGHGETQFFRRAELAEFVNLQRKQVLVPPGSYAAARPGTVPGRRLGLCWVWLALGTLGVKCPIPFEGPRPELPLLGGG